MRVLFVAPSFYPATCYGGPTFVNRDLCEALSEYKTVNLQVLTTDVNGPHSRIGREDQIKPLGYQIIYCRHFIPRDFAPGLLLRLLGMIRRADVIHLNAVYSFTTIPTLVLCKLLRKPMVWSLHGALQKWPGKKKSRKKRVWEKACDLVCDNRRILLHAVSPREEFESTSFIKSAGSVVINYGVEVPQEVHNRQKSNPIRLLFLGRLHPVKGIENLLRALSQTRANVTLDVCGEGDKCYEAQLRSLALELGIIDRVHFRGEVVGDAKLHCFLQADLCVVPSYTEGFATVVTEALAHGVPVIASRGTPWCEIEEKGCGLYVDNSPASLASAIDRILMMPLDEMGQRGRLWMEREFSWQSVSAKMIDTYGRIISANTA